MNEEFSAAVYLDTVILITLATNFIKIKYDF